ncbi:MAG: inositol-3-phosphate synthase [Myxococcales bacterium]
MVGLVIVGLGDVGSAILAGIEAARAHLVHPWGSLVEAGGAGRRPEHAGSQPLRSLAPFANLSDLALGAFELKEDDAFRAALRAGHLSRSLVDELRPQLRQIRAMSGARQAPTRRHLADALAEDLRGFSEHHECSRGVVVCTVPGLSELPGKALFSTSELWSALETSAPEVSPGLVYAAAAARAGYGFVAAAPDAALCSPAVAELFAEAGVPFAGVGLSSPDAALREALQQVMDTEALGLVGATSMTTQVEERGARLWGGPDRTEEMGLGAAWGGGAFEISVQMRGHIALHQAARAVDAALLCELAQRGGRSGAQTWMSALFATSAGPASPHGAPAVSLRERRQQLRAELAVLAKAALASSQAA